MLKRTIKVLMLKRAQSLDAEKNTIKVLMLKRAQSLDAEKVQFTARQPEKNKQI